MFKRAIIVSIIFTLILMLGSGVVGCGQDLQASSPNYFPHNDGYSWEYTCRLTVGSTLESEWTKTVYFDGTATLSDNRVVQKLLISEEVASASVKACSIVGGNGYYQINDGGVYRYGNLSNPTTEATLILPFPLEVGNTWEREGMGTFEVLGVETVEVPAGTFEVFKIGLQGDEFYEWYADGVGMVKSSISALVTRIENGRIVPGEEGIFTEELASKNF
jgi:hypothetical protein